MLSINNPVQDVAISVIAGNTDDTLDVFFRWAHFHFGEINVVVQSENFDNTLDTCKHWAEISNRVRLHVHPFDNFSSQFQRAIDMCTKPWCIQMGADEILMDFPYEQLPELMNRMGNAKVATLPRYNFQADFSHAVGYPDYQNRLIKMGEGIRMDGKDVDETLSFNDKDRVVFDFLPILHLGHLRPSASLIQKGIDRLKFADSDPCDGPPLKKHGITWFVERNKEFDRQAKPINSEIGRWMRKWTQGTYYEKL